MTFLRPIIAATALAAAFFIASAGIDSSASAANEVYTSAQRCNNKQGAGRDFAQDAYVYFDTNSSRLRPQDLGKIKHIYGIAKGKQAQQICLFGKASKIGDARSNAALGRKRATNVAHELERLGWPSSRIVIGTEGEAWGWLEDILTSDSEDDRRVMIRLSQ
ncbi:MAG: OmpA family protein [Parvibaculum sp.]|jgi:outer membrane protein OmpA-like peptidoglycan-associated protein|uniref:OmpA family protein n=1 Tax=Parvibaculum sp. TaxID=2024848 RepID=UPI003C780696